MKKVLTVCALITLLSFQPEPQLTVRLSQSEWENVISIIDNSAVAGEIRKPLVQKIYSQAQAQLKQLMDTTKPKSKN